MKKIVLLLIVFLLSVVLVKANSLQGISPEFIAAVDKCKPYSYKTKPIEILGMKVENTKKIIGVRNSLCNYAEISNLQGTKCITRCKFNRAQLSLFVDYLKELNMNPKLEGNISASGIISEFYNNPNICTTYCAK